MYIGRFKTKWPDSLEPVRFVSKVRSGLSWDCDRLFSNSRSKGRPWKKSGRVGRWGPQCGELVALVIAGLFHIHRYTKLKFRPHINNLDQHIYTLGGKESVFAFKTRRPCWVSPWKAQEFISCPITGLHKGSWATSKMAGTSPHLRDDLKVLIFLIISLAFSSDFSTNNRVKLETTSWCHRTKYGNPSVDVEWVPIIVLSSLISKRKWFFKGLPDLRRSDSSSVENKSGPLNMLNNWWLQSRECHQC